MATAAQVQAQIDQQAKDYAATQSQLQQAQRRQQSLMAGMSRPGASYNTDSSDQVFALNNTINQLNAKLGAIKQQQAQTQGGMDSAKAQDQALAARDQIMGTAQGGIDRLKTDPTDQAFRAYLQQQMGKQTLDPNGKPFENGAPTVAAQQGQASNYNAVQANAAQTQAYGYDPSRAEVGQMDASSVNYRDPFDAQTIGAMVNEQASGAGAAEAARNQLMRDAILANGGNAFDPSLQAAQSESMAERQKAVANARNQINMVANRENAATQNAASMANAGFKQQAGQFNVGSQNQANQFNANAANQAGQYNASANQNAANQNAGFQQQANQFNAGAQNQAGQFNAGANQNASFQNAQLGQQAGMFNTGNQMQAQQANFNAGTQAQMYNQGQQSQAAGQLGAYNNQRQGMLTDAEGRLINVVGQQVFRSPETQVPTQQQFPSFQQWSGSAQSTNQKAPGYGQSWTAPQASGLTGSVWAGSGKPSVGSGYTTSTFGPTGTGTPIYQQASQYVTKPVTKPVTGLAPQYKKPVNPNDPIMD